MAKKVNDVSRGSLNTSADQSGFQKPDEKKTDGFEQEYAAVEDAGGDAQFLKEQLKSVAGEMEDVNLDEYRKSGGVTNPEISRVEQGASEEEILRFIETTAVRNKMRVAAWEKLKTFGQRQLKNIKGWFSGLERGTRASLSRNLLFNKSSALVLLSLSACGDAKNNKEIVYGEAEFPVLKYEEVAPKNNEIGLQPSHKSTAVYDAVDENAVKSFVPSHKQSTTYAEFLGDYGEAHKYDQPLKYVFEKGSTLTGKIAGALMEKEALDKGEAAIQAAKIAQKYADDHGMTLDELKVLEGGKMVLDLKNNILLDVEGIMKTRAKKVVAEKAKSEESKKIKAEKPSEKKAEVQPEVVAKQPEMSKPTEPQKAPEVPVEKPLKAESEVKKEPTKEELEKAKKELEKKVQELYTGIDTDAQLEDYIKSRQKELAEVKKRLGEMYVSRDIEERMKNFLGKKTRDKDVKAIQKTMEDIFYEKDLDLHEFDAAQFDKARFAMLIAPEEFFRQIMHLKTVDVMESKDKKMTGVKKRLLRIEKQLKIVFEPNSQNIDFSLLRSDKPNETIGQLVVRYTEDAYTVHYNTPYFHLKRMQQRIEEEIERAKKRIYKK